MEHDKDLFFDDRQETECMASPKSHWFNLCGFDLKIALLNQRPQDSLLVAMTLVKRDTLPSRVTLQDGSQVAMRLLPWFSERMLMDDAFETVEKSIVALNTTSPVYVFLPEWYRELAKKENSSYLASTQLLFVPKKYVSSNDLIEELFTL